MAAVTKKVLPFVVDPIGAAFGVGVGGAIKDAFEPDRPKESPTKEPAVSGGGGGSVTVSGGRVVREPAATVPDEQDAAKRQRAGGGGSEDVTRGLIRSRSSHGLVA